MLPAVRANKVTVDVCADVDKIRLKYRAAKVRADDAPIRILKFVVFVLCDMCYTARAAEILVPGFIIRFIDRNMASRVLSRPSVDQNVTLLRLGIGNSRPASGEVIRPVFLAIASGRLLAEKRIVGGDQRHALAAANGLPVQASDPVDRIVRCFAVGRGRDKEHVFSYVIFFLSNLSLYGCTFAQVHFLCKKYIFTNIFGQEILINQCETI